MSLKALLTILIVLILGIIFLKAIRKLLSIALMIVLLYFFYYTLFTFPGAVKFALFRETLAFSSYKVDVTNYNEAKTYSIDPTIKVGKYDIYEIRCEESGPVEFCYAKGNKTE